MRWLSVRVIVSSRSQDLPLAKLCFLHPFPQGGLSCCQWRHRLGRAQPRSGKASKTRIDLISGQNDVMAMGTKKALKEHASDAHRDVLIPIPVTGCEGVPSTGQAWVRTGRSSFRHSCGIGKFRQDDCPDDPCSSKQDSDW
jgi:hypothetical protein